jgi:hypothetical protein
MPLRLASDDFVALEPLILDDFVARSTVIHDESVAYTYKSLNPKSPIGSLRYKLIVQASLAMIKKAFPDNAIEDAFQRPATNSA